MQTPLKIAKIEEVIAQAANVRVEDIRSKRRDREIADARHAIWFVAHDHLGYSYTLLGEIYEKDHTTVLAGVRRMRKAKAKQTIIEGIKKVAPDIFDGKPEPGEPRSIETWTF